MKELKKLDEIISHVKKCQVLVKRFTEQTEDYDMERALKKADAELMDALHNLGLVREQMKPGKTE